MNKRENKNTFCEQTLVNLIGPTAEVRVFEEIDSTNNEAKRMALEGVRTPVLIAASRQTAGRGRMGRSFYSPAQTGVYCSILYRLDESLETSVSITGATAVAVMRAIYRITGLQTAIKWVNDLYWNGKKVCGILAEAVTVGNVSHLIVGIGINLSTREFPKDLEGRAGSLNLKSDLRMALIAEIWRELWPSLQDPRDRAWLDDYRRYSCVIGQAIVWYEGETMYCGIAEAINGDGELLVAREDGTAVLLRTGEITLRLLDDRAQFQC